MVYRDALHVPPILVIGFGGRIFGVSPTTGERLWEYEKRISMGVVRLAVTDARVYALVGGQLLCLEYATGRELWQVAIGIASDTLMVEGGLVFVAGLGELRCFGAEGNLLWHDAFKGKGMAVVALGLPGHSVQADATG